MSLDVLPSPSDESGCLPLVRRSLLCRAGSGRVILRLLLLDGSLRDLACPLVPEDPSLTESIFLSTAFNALAVFSAREVTVFLDSSDSGQLALFSRLDEWFQVRRGERTGLGKPINIANRLCSAIGAAPFRFRLEEFSLWSPLPPYSPPDSGSLPERLRSRVMAAAEGCRVGIDIGGTDIKLAASRAGRLAYLKEFDWDPASYTTAEQILDPILLLVRLMRVCLAWDPASLPPDLAAALGRDAGLDQMEQAVIAAEASLGDRANLLDGVGVSFPDIVIGDRILGGETPKTKGLRENPSRPYEIEFARLGRLRDPILTLCRPGGDCHICNDGSMAAFTAAAELSFGDDPDSVREGVIAHTLGTDLGTGWLTADGRIPQIPLELYDLLLDLGADPSREYPARDLRSKKNENSGLCGVRRYLGQAAAFRLAWELDPDLLRGFAEEQDGLLVLPDGDRDLRKPCLEHLMSRAEAGDPAAEEIFRRIGQNLAMVCLEMEYLASPRPKTRWLFGRFVRSPRCFALICQGFDGENTGLTLRAADRDLANTSLMRQLAARPDATVAQFGQAVGAIYYSLP